MSEPSREALPKDCDLLVYLNSKAIRDDGRVHLDISFDELKQLRAAVAAKPERERVIEPNLLWLVDWTYIYATEGVWLGTDTAKKLIALSERKPTQADADHFKSGGLIRALKGDPA